MYCDDARVRRDPIGQTSRYLKRSGARRTDKFIQYSNIGEVRETIAVSLNISQRRTTKTRLVDSDMLSTATEHVFPIP